LFDEADALEIGKWLKGTRRIYIQQFKKIKTLDKDFLKRRSFAKEELENFHKIMKPFFETCEIRGA
jgi:hypothetical protein